MKPVACVFLASCAMFSTSRETATRDMRLYVTLGSNDQGTHLTAELTGPFGDPGLGPDDDFTILAAGAHVDASRNASAAWAADVATRGGDFSFALHHQGDHDVTTIASLPPPSGVHAASALGKLVIDWTPQPNVGEATLTVAGTCIRTQTIAILTDTGHYELEGAELQSLPAACDLAIGLSRSAQTTEDFEGATFMYATITQAESAEASWTP